ncbi:MAG: hypothetical protein E5Y07_19495 [Mesorhizobium sp.]|nr:MAG: hypothetical protein E5Y07_19495 [Mesorhizobium sp.]
MVTERACLAHLPHALPALVDAAGERARWRFLEFFTAHIRNPNTRRAYSKDIGQFLDWCQAQGVHDITEIHTLHVATYVELLTSSHAAPTISSPFHEAQRDTRAN